MKEKEPSIDQVTLYWIKVFESKHIQSEIPWNLSLVQNMFCLQKTCLLGRLEVFPVLDKLRGMLASLLIVRGLEPSMWSRPHACW